jgi:hypothetical protein
MFEPWSGTAVALELARRLSHDVRSPLTSGIAVLQLACEDQDINQSRDLLESLLENQRQHERFIEILLFWSRLELGVYRPEFTSMNLEAVLNTMLTIPQLEPRLICQDPLVCGSFPLEWLRTLLHFWAIGLNDLCPGAHFPCDLIHTPHGFSIEVHAPAIEQFPYELFPLDTPIPSLPALAGLALFCCSRGFLALDGAIHKTTNGWNITLPFELFDPLLPV